LNDLSKNILLWVVIAVVLISVFNSFNTSTGQVDTIAYSEFLRDVKDGNVRHSRVTRSSASGSDPASS